MAKQTINLGTAPTGVGGDTPRSAFTKAQSNIDELYAALGASGSPAALPSALPVAQGGTGGTTQATARTGLGLGSAAVAAIVGTVSQTGGVPTGAIVETGANANGVYTKFADGTLICRGSTVATTASNAFGGFYYSGTLAMAFPVAFTSVPSISASATSPSGALCWAVSSTPSTNSVGYYNGISSTNGASVTIYWAAIGRWF